MGGLSLVRGTGLAPRIGIGPARSLLSNGCPAQHFAHCGPPGVPNLCYVADVRRRTLHAADPRSAGRIETDGPLTIPSLLSAKLRSCRRLWWESARPPKVGPRADSQGRMDHARSSPGQLTETSTGPCWVSPRMTSRRPELEDCGWTRFAGAPAPIP